MRLTKHIQCLVKQQVSAAIKCAETILLHLWIFFRRSHCGCERHVDEFFNHQKLKTRLRATHKTHWMSWQTTAKIAFRTTVYSTVRPRLNGENVCRGRRVTRRAELSWTSELFLRFLTKLGDPFTWETINLVHPFSIVGSICNMKEIKDKKTMA